MPNSPTSNQKSTTVLAHPNWPGCWHFWQTHCICVQAQKSSSSQAVTPWPSLVQGGSCSTHQRTTRSPQQYRAAHPNWPGCWHFWQTHCIYVQAQTSSFGGFVALWPSLDRGRGGCQPTHEPREAPTSWSAPVWPPSVYFWPYRPIEPLQLQKSMYGWCAVVRPSSDRGILGPPSWQGFRSLLLLALTIYG
jgi:hypothetical protein